MILGRRSFLTGLSGLIAAPAVVRAASLMPVKVVAPEPMTVLRGVMTELVQVRPEPSTINTRAVCNDLGAIMRMMEPGLRALFAEVNFTQPWDPA